MEVLDREARGLKLPLSLVAVLANIELEDAFKAESLTNTQMTALSEALNRANTP